MENPDYLSGKRYADIMKTMWFTFFYAPWYIYLFKNFFYDIYIYIQ